MIGARLRRWRLRRLLGKRAIPFPLWNAATRRIPLLSGLGPVRMAKLRALSSWFLARKSVYGVQGLEVTPPMQVEIAAQACLLILDLGSEYYSGWVDVKLYPGAFRVKLEEADEIGLVHEGIEDRTGESWLNGPVILSWEDVSHSGPGWNVVLHEFAHKLDGLGGSMNGMPPLHPGMSRRDWAQAFGRAYEALCDDVDDGLVPCIDPYAAESPAEFFAVATEYFYSDPLRLKSCYPEVYRQLDRFYHPRGS